MARVVVMNPPKKHRKRRRKSLAAKKIKRKTHRVRRHKRKKAVVLAAKKIRRRRVRRKKRIVRKARRKTRKHFNPFGGEMIMLGNPHRRKSRRKNMARRKHKRRRSGRALMNPFSASGLLSKPREMFTTEFATEAVAGVAGFMLPNVVLGMLPVAFKDSKLKIYASKVLVIAGLSTAAGMVNKKAARFVLLGGGMALLLDIWAEWRARATPAPAGTSAYYGGGDEGVGAYYGGDPFLGDDVVLG